MTDARTAVQAVIFVTLFVSLVLVLPVLTRKRTQCGLFCPFGAMQSLTNKVNIFDVRIDPEKCTQCGLCWANCVTDQPLPLAIAAARAHVVEAGSAPATVTELDRRLAQALRHPSRATPD